MSARPDRVRLDPESLTLESPASELALRLLTEDEASLDWQALDRQLAEAGGSVDAYHMVLTAGHAALVKLFLDGQDVDDLVRARAGLVDRIVVCAWQRIVGKVGERMSIVAVGGYGRGELHPYSDVDLLVLSPPRLIRKGRTAISDFLAFLWDVGLEIGHSVRSVADCRTESRHDITVATTLMESRLLCGPSALYEKMVAAVAPPDIWPSRTFFEAKLKEQQARHHRYNDTAYNLEPNVKGSPGGLRDIQMIAWVACRKFGTGDLEQLVDHEYLTRDQLRALTDGRSFLWRIRFALHVLTGRREDRLLFDHQVRLARMFGYKDASYTLAVEQLMQRYYRTVMELSRLNEMLLQLFQEAILMNPNVEPEPIGDNFQLRNGFVQVSREDVFAKNPSALLEMFLVMQQHPDVNGVSAKTITLVRQHLHLIDDEFRQNPHNHELFLQILRAPAGVTHELRRMNLYGVLGSYIPAFGRIVGRMQYDLFHAYTVDAHTLFVVSNLRRFALARFDHEFPRCSEIMQALPIPEIAYIAGLFHDIAKGRGGDHSELGAIEAESFCLEHGMNRYDARLAAWLVRQHLTLSMIAQKRDIDDPAVIHEFASLVGDETHLDYLYLLTCADVRATNPNLWNSWKAQLFDELYEATRHALRRGLETPIDKEYLVHGKKTAARRILSAAGFDDSGVDQVWGNMGEEYFLRFRPEEIAWHTQVLGSDQALQAGALAALTDEPGAAGTALFVQTPEDWYSFAIVTAILDELGLNIVDARVVGLSNGQSVSGYIVLEESGRHVGDERRLGAIRSRLLSALNAPATANIEVTRRAPRQVRLFDTPVHVTFATDARNRHTVMELVAGDRPGLLSDIAKVLRDMKIRIRTAKVVTVGERAEDVFYITGNNQKPLDTATCEALEEALTSALRAAA